MSRYSYFSTKRVPFIAVVILPYLTILAHAETKTWIGPHLGAWNSSNNWSPSGEPDADDDAVLPTRPLPYTVSVGAAGGTAATLTVGNRVTVHIFSLLFTPALTLDHLNLAEGGTIDLQGFLILAFPLLELRHAGTSSIDGLIRLDALSTLRIACCEHEFAGSGTIELNGGDISIKADATLRSDIFIRLASGAEIQAQGGTFDNSGLLRSAGGACRIRSGTLKGGNATDRGLFEITTGSLEVSSAVNVVDMAGDVRVSGGTLDVKSTFSTSGSLRFTGGTIRVSAGKHFSAD